MEYYLDDGVPRVCWGVGKAVVDAGEVLWVLGGCRYMQGYTMARKVKLG